MKPEAITFDFYRTLVRPRGEKGRGGLYRDFLAQHGLQGTPWEHEVLYDMFPYYAEKYDPRASSDAKLQFWAEFARRLFERTDVAGDRAALAQTHAAAICDIFGPNHFEVYPDVIDALRGLNHRGIPLAILSNWQAGLAKFCHELGIREHFAHVIASAEVGHEKPDIAIFAEASRRLAVLPPAILHVGDSPEDDLRGATAAGLACVLIDRDGLIEATGAQVVHDLREILDLTA